MKYLLLFLIFALAFSNTIFSQNGVNAGLDKEICVDFFGIVDTTELEGSLSNINPPYTILWEMNYNFQGSSIFLHASDFLNDTTILAPKVISSSGIDNNIPLTFHLIVVDSLGSTYTDSTIIRFSKFSQLLASCDKTINAGDSIDINALIGGGIPPLYFSWQPNYNISNTSIRNPIVWPDTSTEYIVEVTDSVGCVSSFKNSCVIKVNTTGLKDNTNIDTGFPKIFPNPSSQDFNIIINNKVLSLKIFNIYGIEVGKYDNLIIGLNRFSLNKVPKGIYFWKIESENKTIHVGSIIKK